MTSDVSAAGKHAVAIVHTLEDLQSVCAGWRQKGERVALAPTMGALHQGHLALVHAAREQAHRVVVSIFVNPTQFAPGEDFASYPRTLAEDCALLGSANADLVYAPSAAVLYPQGFATRIVPAGAACAGLEDAYRPTHFEGVATVVVKLLAQVAPHTAFFGEKDYQQLQVVRQVVRDLNMAVEICGVATVREADGLALSSRNRYLSAEERALAPLLHETLQTCRARIQAGEQVVTALAQAKEALATATFGVDYLEARDAGTLACLADRAGEREASQPVRLLAAARIGTTRLIDTIAF